MFNVDVRDPFNTSSKQVYLVVYPTNPPPVLGQTGFRISAPYGLVFGDPSGTTHAYIELPTSSATLQVGISDLANSDFTGRGLWSLVSQPAGANVALGSTTYIYVSIRANVSGMTVPGDYVFQVNITNPGQPDLTAQIICTVNNATSRPVISSITASPASMTTLPTSATQLSAVTSGSTNQPLRHWWAVKTTPTGAHPLFNHQGTTNTSVSNLVLPGTYTFTLRAFDDLHMTTQDKTVTVGPPRVRRSSPAPRPIPSLSGCPTDMHSLRIIVRLVTVLPVCFGRVELYQWSDLWKPVNCRVLQYSTQCHQRQRRRIWQSRLDGETAVAGDYESTYCGWIGECGLQLHNPVRKCRDSLRCDKFTRWIDVEFRDGRHHRHADERRCLHRHDQRLEYHRPDHTQPDCCHLYWRRSNTSDQ